jgi:hypothetical protein
LAADCIDGACLIRLDSIEESGVIISLILVVAILISCFLIWKYCNEKNREPVKKDKRRINLERRISSPSSDKSIRQS